MRVVEYFPSLVSLSLSLHRFNQVFIVEGKVVRHFLLLDLFAGLELLLVLLLKHFLRSAEDHFDHAELVNRVEELLQVLSY